MYKIVAEKNVADSESNTQKWPKLAPNILFYCSGNYTESEFRRILLQLKSIGRKGISDLPSFKTSMIF